LYSFSECLAHPPDDYLKDHLKSVAVASRDVWGKQPSVAADTALLSGLLHDIGKAGKWFQDRINGTTKGKTAYSHHSMVSAVFGWYVSSGVASRKEDVDRFRLSVFSAILRHHSDLRHPWAEEISLVKQRVGSPTEEHLTVLSAQLDSMDLEGIEDWLRNVAEELVLPLVVPPLTPERIISAISTVRPLRLRNCFNTLDDAVEFLSVYSSLLQFDKIHSATGKLERQRPRLPDALADDYVRQRVSKPDSALGCMRNNISKEIEHSIMADTSKLFLTVTAPTGSGKTLAILNAALKLRTQLEREKGTVPALIYCLPFTSVIDQNHTVFRDVLEFGGFSVNSELLLKHHHLSDPIYVSSDPEFDADDSELFIETWRSEIIVTTFYQLLHCMISRKNRNLKRLISLRDAIVVLDEVQAVPYRYWTPIRRLFQAIGNRLNTRFILMTATQPLLFTGEMSTELLPTHEDYFHRLSRVTLTNKAAVDTSLEDFFQIVNSELKSNPGRSRMCVLNRRSAVARVHSMLKESMGSHRLYALSASLTPKDRRERIEEISKNLLSGIPCVIITTQLVEAGVDISVDVVDRDMAPLDSIIQACGRCNRHAGQTKGRVNLWSLRDSNENLWKRVYDPFLIDATAEVLAGRLSIDEAEFLGLGRLYFEAITKRSEPDKIDEILTAGMFSEIEANFKLIDDDGPRQSYFIIKSDEDRAIWEDYRQLDQIEDPLERRRVYDRLKAGLLDCIVQVYVHGRSDNVNSIVPIEPVLGLYDDDLGFMGERNMPGSVIL
jgi:CRISPR-associated endonuclease/helicase Cas3